MIYRVTLGIEESPTAVRARGRTLKVGKEEELRCILDPQDVYALDFPDETFRTPASSGGGLEFRGSEVRGSTIGFCILAQEIVDNFGRKSTTIKGSW